MGLPCSIRVNGSDFRVRTRQAAFRDIVMDTLRGAETVFCPGQALRRDMIAAGVNERRIVAFNNGVNRDVFRCRPCDGEGTGAGVVLFVGHLAHVKGPDLLLHAWARMRGSHVSGFGFQKGSGEDVARGELSASFGQFPRGTQRPCAESGVPDSEPGFSTGPGSPETSRRLLLIGDGPMRRGLEKLAGRLGIEDSVVFLGARSQEAVAQWMNRAHCLCLPSRSEGMPNVVLEALACGLPVVATEAGETPYLVKDGENGFLVRGENDVPARLAAALRQTLERKWDRQYISSSAMTCTWDQAAGTILEG